MKERYDDYINDDNRILVIPEGCVIANNAEPILDLTALVVKEMEHLGYEPTARLKKNLVDDYFGEEIEDKEFEKLIIRFKKDLPKEMAKEL